MRSLRELLRRQPPQETPCPRCGVPAPPGDIECTACGARFFDRRNACASCSGREFKKVAIPTDGEVRAFTIVTPFIPGTDPYVPAVVDCDGTSVRGTIVNTPPDTDHVSLGMKVRLTTFSIGADSTGTEAITYGFEPAN